MSVLAVRIGAGVLALLALITLRGKRWAYFAFVVLGLLYFPAQTHFRVHVPKCEQLLPTIQVLVLSLHNYAYIALFAGFYWMSWVAFRRSDARGIWALVATLLVAALVEIAEGMTGGGRGQVHCRVRDLVPDAAGALGAALLGLGPRSTADVALTSPDDVSINSFLRILYSLALVETRGLVVHAASLVRDGRAYLFSGRSGSGKTTVARLSTDATLLSDELSIVRMTKGSAV